MASASSQPESRESSPSVLVVGKETNSLRLLLEAVTHHRPNVRTEAVASPAVGVARLVQRNYDIVIWMGTATIPFLREAKSQGTAASFILLTDVQIAPEDELLLKTVPDVSTTHGEHALGVIENAIDRVSLLRRLHQANRQSDRDAQARQSAL
jgi:hypothetical protein